MKVGGQHFRTIWLHPTNERVVQLIDQRFLPHRFVVEDVSTVEQMADATAAPLRKKGHASQSLQQIEHQLA